MADPRAEDLVSLDRDVAHAARGLAAWRAKLAKDAEEAAGKDPIEPVRHVAGKSTWDALRALAPGLADAPLRDALVPWVGTLVLARLGRDDELAVARAEQAKTAPYRGEVPGLASAREAWRGVVAARNAAEARLWVEAAAEASVAVADAARTAAETRLEVARRLGLAHPWDLAGVGEASALRASARRFLDATEDLARAVEREALRGEADVAGTVQLALARDASEGWPAHLGPRWLEELFGAHLAGLRVELPPLPLARGAASFARALGLLGFAARLAMAPAGVPFAIARDPASRAAHRLGFVFAALAADAGWQARALSLGKRAAIRQARVLSRTALLDARLHAVRLLLGDDAFPAPRDLFDELLPRLSGAPADARLRGAFPRARRDEPARFVALVESLSAGRALRERFDVDWWRNPRAWADLRASSSAPAREPAPGDGFGAEVDALGRAFEEALG
ncbi:MAG TPA: hypothetical protein VGG39_31635 [Polyangiaceae bacterium]|jgi:hypothetical protein